MKTHKQLTYGLRCQIYALEKIGLSQNKIAQQLKVSQSSISRELPVILASDRLFTRVN